MICSVFVSQIMSARKMSVSTSTTEGNQASSGYEYPIPFMSYDNNISSSSSTSSRSSSTSIISEIEEEEQEEEEEENYNSSRSRSRSNTSQPLFEFNDGNGMPMPLAPIKEETESSFFSFDVVTQEEDVIYVAVGKSQSSMDALSWTLRHAVNPSTSIFLIHVFPPVKFVPSPCKLPRNQVNPEQLETFMAQERGKRRQLLQKFLDACSKSKVMADTMLIESDLVAKAILDLIPILNIGKLVVGTTKSCLRKLKSGRISGIADHILQSAPETCDIKVVCEGKEVIDQMINDSPSPRNNDHNSPKASQEKNEIPDSFSCMCFKI